MFGRSSGQRDELMPEVSENVLYLEGLGLDIDIALEHLVLGKFPGGAGLSSILRLGSALGFG